MEYESLLNVNQVAEMFGLSVATIRKWVLLRYIPYQKMGRSVRFSASELRSWQQSRTVLPLKEQSTDKVGAV
jgi:excisionase family DNA binding protein